MTCRIFIGVGSNIAPEDNLVRALRLVRASADVVRVSTHYWTVPLGGRDIPRFVNGVWEIATGLMPQELVNNVLKKAEAACGRTLSSDRYGSRPVDLDLLLYGGLVLAEPGIELPHPDIVQRLFVALPLLELAPGLGLPGTERPLDEVVRALKEYEGAGSALVPHHELTERLRKEIAA